ncbi:MAG: hypothetical protein JW934_08700 [Anaerolineae bacterium]|nr:hypothetical protein [Anaerolineae bacterium]
MVSSKNFEPNCICGVDLTPAYAEQVGRAVGTRMAAGRLVVGGDTRPSTPLLKEALIAGLLSTGCEVYDVGTLPVPALSFAKDRFWADGAVMVTASHRPPQENGFKITLGKFPTTIEEIQDLLDAVESGGPFASGSGKLVIQNTLEPYATFLVARFVPTDSLRVTVDTGNGTMRRLVTPILLSMEYEVTEREYESPDILVPDPSLDAPKAALIQAVLDNHAHLGVAFDGDGDRVIFASERGRVLDPGLVIALLARALLTYQPGSQVIYDDSYAPFVADVVRQCGGVPTQLSGIQSDLKRAFLERGAILGGDRWGHYFFRAMGGDDPLYAMLVLLRLISRTEGGLESLIADYVND